MPSLLFLDGVVASFVPSPGRWKSKTSTASSYPQYILQKVSHCVGQSVLLYLLGRDTIECHTVRSNIPLSVINNFIRRTELSAEHQKESLYTRPLVTHSSIDGVNKFYRTVPYRSQEAIATWELSCCSGIPHVIKDRSRLRDNQVHI